MLKLTVMHGFDMDIFHLILKSSSLLESNSSSLGCCLRPTGLGLNVGRRPVLMMSALSVLMVLLSLTDDNTVS